jgi:hypothetical protein
MRCYISIGRTLRTLPMRGSPGAYFVFQSLLVSYLIICMTVAQHHHIPWHFRCRQQFVPGLFRVDFIFFEAVFVLFEAASYLSRLLDRVLLSKQTFDLIWCSHDFCLVEITLRARFL